MWFSSISYAQVPDSTFRSYNWLSPAMVSGKTDLVDIKNDTLTYNVSSALIHDGEALDRLLIEIPGIEIDPSGNVFLNGKKVEQLLVMGQRYYGGDVKAALKNIPSRMVGSVRSFERNSDFGRLSGVAQNERETVLDIRIKKDYQEKWSNYTNLAGGIKNKYSGRYSGSRINDSASLSIMGGAANISPIQESSLSSMRQGIGDSGEKRMMDAGLTWAGKAGKAEMNASLLIDGNVHSTPSTQYTEYFKANGYHFSKGNGLEEGNTFNINGQYTIEWKTKNKVYFQIKPTFALSKSRKNESLFSQSFKEESESPYYDSDRKNQAAGNSYKGGLIFIASKRFQKPGRSLSFSADASFSREEDDILSDMLMTFRIRKESITTRKRSSDCAFDIVGLNTQLLWREPLSKNQGITLSYKQDLKRSFTDRENHILEDGNDITDVDNTASGIYYYYSGTFAMNYQYSGKKLKLTGGLSFIPGVTSFRFDSSPQFRDTSSVLFHITPTVTLDYNFSRTNHLSLNVKAYMTSPTLKQMMPISPNTNPLYIQVPNTNLKPSFTRDISLSWALSDKKSKNGVQLSLRGKLIEDDITSFVSYNDKTGGRLVSPTNIDGSWNGNGGLVLYHSFKDFLFCSTSSASISHKPAYLFNNVSKTEELCNIDRASAKEAMLFSYRKSNFEMNMLFEGEVFSSSVSLRPDMDQMPRSLSAGLSSTFKAGKGWILSMDVKNKYFRGFPIEELNESQLIANAKISKTLLGERLTLQLDARDILNRYKNEVYTAFTESRSLNVYGGSASYLLIRAIFWLN